MSEKNIEMMKQIIEDKKLKQKEQSKKKPDKKIGAGKAGINSQKHRGSNNKV